MFIKPLSVSLMTSLSIDLMLFMRVCLCNDRGWRYRKKWTLFSTLILHEQSRLIQSLYLWLNLWSLGWLKPNRTRVSNFNPVGLWILYVSLHLSLNSLFLNVKYNSDDFMILSKLFYLLTVHGINEFLKSSDLTLKFGKRAKS